MSPEEMLERYDDMQKIQNVKLNKTIKTHGQNKLDGRI